MTSVTTRAMSSVLLSLSDDGDARLPFSTPTLVRSYCATVGKIDGPTVRCDDGVDSTGATVPRDNTASTKTICSIGSCASYVVDDDDLGWTVVNRGSNKSKTKT